MHVGTIDCPVRNHGGVNLRMTRDRCSCRLYRREHARSCWGMCNTLHFQFKSSKIMADFSSVTADNHRLPNGDDGCHNQLHQFDSLSGEEDKRSRLFHYREKFFSISTLFYRIELNAKTLAPVDPEPVAALCLIAFNGKEFINFGYVDVPYSSLNTVTVPRATYVLHTHILPVVSSCAIDTPLIPLDRVCGARTTIGSVDNYTGIQYHQPQGRHHYRTVTEMINGLMDLAVTTTMQSYDVTCARDVLDIWVCDVMSG